jgi:hypothetical protein
VKEMEKQKYYGKYGKESYTVKNPYKQKEKRKGKYQQLTDHKKYY